MRFPVRLLAAKFFAGLNRHITGGPDLRMRVRIAATHHLPAVLKDLHIGDVRSLIQFPEFIRQQPEYSGNLIDGHVGQVQIMPFRIAHHAAAAAFGLGSEQGLDRLFRTDFG